MSIENKTLTPKESIEFLATLLEDKYSLKWLKQSIEHKVFFKLSTQAQEALANPESSNWDLFNFIKTDSKRFKKKLSDAETLNQLILNSIKFNTLSEFIKKQVYAACKSTFDKESFFKDLPNQEERLLGKNQNLPFNDLDLGEIILVSALNTEIINIMSRDLELCTHHHIDKIGKTQQKLLIISKDNTFLGVFTYYPHVNAFFISGNKNERINPDFETLLISSLQEHNVLNKDSIQLFSQTQFNMANNIAYSFNYDPDVEKLENCEFTKRAYNHFLVTKDKKEKLDSINVFTPEVIYSSKEEDLTPFNIRKKIILKRLKDPDERAALLESIKYRIQFSDDATEIEFIESLLDENSAYSPINIYPKDFDER